MWFVIPLSQKVANVPFHSPGDLPHPGIKSVSPALADGFFTTEPSELNK